MSAPRVKGGVAKRSRDATRERTAAATNKAVVNKGEPSAPASQAATQEGHVRPEMVRIVADSASVPNLSADVGQLLAPDVEYRLREIIQVRFPSSSRALAVLVARSVTRDRLQGVESEGAHSVCTESGDHPTPKPCFRYYTHG
jgi:hypothetical protein